MAYGPSIPSGHYDVSVKIRTVPQTLARGPLVPILLVPGPLPESLRPQAVDVQYCLARDEDVGAGYWQSTVLGGGARGRSICSFTLGQMHFLKQMVP